MVKRILLGSILLLATTAQAAETGGLKDPLRPLKMHGSGAAAANQKPPAEQIEWQLGAVLIGDDRAVAMVNGQPLQLGDQLNGYQVREIAREQVVLQKGRKEIVLRRAGTGLKKALDARAGEGSQP